MSTIAIGFKAGSDYIIDQNCDFEWWCKDLELVQDSKEFLLFQIGWNKAHGNNNVTFADFLKANAFKEVHGINDNEGTFIVYSNGDFTIKSYWDENGSNIYPFFNNGNYVLQLNRLTDSSDFSS